MKTKNWAYPFIILALLTSACGNEKQKEETTEVKSETPVKAVDISLKTVTNSKQGYSIGLPEGWTLEDGGEVNGDINFTVRRGDEPMFTIVTGTKIDQDKTLQWYLDSYGEDYEFIVKDDHVKSDNIERTGVIVKSKTMEGKNTNAEFFLFFKGGKFPYANIMLGDYYTPGTADSCYAAIKSIHLQQ